MSWFGTFVQKSHYLLTSIYYFFSYALNIHSFSSVFPQLQVSVAFVEQIDYLLIVNL